MVTPNGYKKTGQLKWNLYKKKSNLIIAKGKLKLKEVRNFSDIRIKIPNFEKCNNDIYLLSLSSHTTKINSVGLPLYKKEINSSKLKRLIINNQEISDKTLHLKMENIK